VNDNGTEKTHVCDVRYRQPSAFPDEAVEGVEVVEAEAEVKGEGARVLLVTVRESSVKRRAARSAQE